MVNIEFKQRENILYEITKVIKSGDFQLVIVETSIPSRFVVWTLWSKPRSHVLFSTAVLN